eukprot:1184839-Prorocentrum_minimum.AAC.1
MKVLTISFAPLGPPSGLTRRFAQLKEIDTEGVEPAVRAGQEDNVFREDVPVTWEGRYARIAVVIKRASGGHHLTVQSNPSQIPARAVILLHFTGPPASILHFKSGYEAHGRLHLTVKSP